MKDSLKMWNKWRDWRLEEKIPMGFAGYKNYFDTIEKGIERVERNMKTLIKDLARDKDGDYKKEVLELQKIYKRNLIEFKVKLADFKRKNTDD
mgnify:CR=1 FL=1|tara:strand:+ start:942 stop:1220 length:279 start_codon:yes stop_codon:yes gene_type:complete